MGLVQTDFQVNSWYCCASTHERMILECPSMMKIREVQTFQFMTSLTSPT